MEAHKIQIKHAENENLLDIELCAKEFIDFIDNFKKNFLEGRFFILTAYYDFILAGVLIAEKKVREIDSLEKIIPSIQLHLLSKRFYLLFVNSKFRNNQIGTKLLESFINIQKQNDIASIYIELPQKYKIGINFLQKKSFQRIGKKQNNVILELKLWNDYGIIDSQVIEDDFNDILS